MKEENPTLQCVNEQMNSEGCRKYFFSDKQVEVPEGKFLPNTVLARAFNQSLESDGV